MTEMAMLAVFFFNFVGFFFGIEEKCLLDDKEVEPTFEPVTLMPKK